MTIKVIKEDFPDIEQTAELFLVCFIDANPSGVNTFLTHIGKL
jgi:hypothetical protein